MLTNNNETAKKIKNFDEYYPKWLNFDRIKQKTLAGRYEYAAPGH